MTQEPESPPQVDRQREHQANERTFLAWLRTAIALIGFGFAIARFGLFLRQFQAAVEPQAAEFNPLLTSESLGAGLAIAGIAVITLALWNYNRVHDQIERARYQPNRLLVWLTGGFVILLGLLSLPLVLLRQPPVTPRSRRAPSEMPLDLNGLAIVSLRRRKRQRRNRKRHD
jgi:putative membrane protein